MSTTAQPRAVRTLIAAAVLGALVLGACGGDDDDSGSDGGGSTAESSDSGELVDNEVRDVISDGIGTDGDVDLESAIATLSPETRYSVVAGQLEPEPEVQIDGSDIRLVFDGGSLVDSTMSCIIASVVQEKSETVTLVYPDGEQVC